jgi:hypothetical protein
MTNVIMTFPKGKKVPQQDSAAPDDETKKSVETCSAELARLLGLEKNKAVTSICGVVTLADGSVTYLIMGDIDPFRSIGFLEGLKFDLVEAGRSIVSCDCPNCRGS